MDESVVNEREKDVKELVCGDESIVDEGVTRHTTCRETRRSSLEASVYYL